VTAALIAILFFTSGRDLAAATQAGKDLRRQSQINTTAQTDFATAQERYGKVERKWRLLRDKARTGPALQRALAIFSSVLRSDDFKEIHAMSITWDATEVLTSPGDDKEKRAVGEESTIRHLDIEVKFQAKVQALGRAPAQVYANFIRTLREETNRHVDVEMEDQPLQQGERFNFTLRFSPPEALSKPAAEGDETEQDNG
jgi:hypothetical protein